MRGRHLVLAVVGIILLFTVSVSNAQSAGASASVRATPKLWRLPKVPHHIPGKQYRGQKQRLTQRTSGSPRQVRRGDLSQLPSVMFLIQPKVRIATRRSDKSLLQDDNDVLPGFDYLREIQIVSPKSSEAASPTSDSPQSEVRQPQPIRSEPIPSAPNQGTWRPGSTKSPTRSPTSTSDSVAPKSKPRLDETDPRSFFERPGEKKPSRPAPEASPTPAASTTPAKQPAEQSENTANTSTTPPAPKQPATDPTRSPDPVQRPDARQSKPAAAPQLAPSNSPGESLIDDDEIVPDEYDPPSPSDKPIGAVPNAAKSGSSLLPDEDWSLLADEEDVLPTPQSSALQEQDNTHVKPPTTYKNGFDELLPPSRPTPSLDNDLIPHGQSNADDDDNDDSDEGDDQNSSDVDPHLELLSKNMYPSAKECGKCHEDHYREWSVSAHAYASVSPMFHKFEQTINDLSKGTIGYFCMRCHAPVAVSICETRDSVLWESIPAANEGVTCIACHRVIERYFKVNGERRIETGSIFAPVVGASNQNKLHEIIAKKDHYKVKTSPDEKGPGQAIHNDVICFEQLSSSHFCVSCHQVAVHPGIKLEIVWDQYRASPACKQGVSCQDCHMGAVPGKAEGYATGPTAIVGGKKIHPNRKHSNHMFYGPGYSIAHPGTFPHNTKADDWSIKEWLDFDWRSGWGTEDFEDMLDEGKIDAKFPKVWEEVDDRMDARDIINENLQLLAEKKHTRFELMEHTSKVEGPYFAHAPKAGKTLKFKYRVRNLNSGHNMPSGSLGAQPQVWLNVVLTGPHGDRLWESGYVDANGDVADVHSLEVAAGRIPRDRQLFNLQTKFLTTGVKGTDREMYLPINVDIDQLPFIRPSGLPITNLNHPPFIRLENHSLPPLGARDAKYKVPAKCMQTPGRYRLSVRMRSRAEPIYFMRFCKATPEMERRMNERMLDFHQHAYEFIVR